MERFHKGGIWYLDGYIMIENHTMSRRRDLYSFPLPVEDLETMVWSKTEALRNPILGGKLMGKYAIFYIIYPWGSSLKLIHPLVVRGIGAHMGTWTVSRRACLSSSGQTRWCMCTPTFVLFTGWGRSGWRERQRCGMSFLMIWVWQQYWVGISQPGS